MLIENEKDISEKDSTTEEKSNDKAKSGSRLRGRVKKIPEFINYNQIAPPEYPNKDCNSSQVMNKLEDFIRNAPCVNEQEKSSFNVSPKIPRAKHDLILFDDIIEESDYSMHFLINNKDISEKGNDGEQHEDILIRMRNSGSFHQTELLKCGGREVIKK